MKKKDILESFSKVHKRHLRLLEQDEELPPEEQSIESRKQAAIAKLNGINWTQKVPGTNAWQGVIETGVPAVNSGSTTRDLGYNVQTGKLTASNNFAQAQALPLNSTPQPGGGDWVQDLAPFPNRKPKSFTQFLGILVGDTELTKSKTQRDIEEKTRPGAVLDQIGDVFSPEITQQIKINLESIATNLDPVWQGMSEENQQAYQNNLQEFQKQFVGTSKASFENKLLTDKVNLGLVNGEWTSTTLPPTAMQSLLVSESVKDLVMLAGSDNPSPEQCENVVKDFAIQAGTDRIIISPKGDGDDRILALSFSDPKKTIRNTLIRAARQCQPNLEDAESSIKIVRVQGSDNTEEGGGDNAARGFAFEEILEVFSLMQLRNQSQRGIEDGSDLEELIVRKAVTVQKRLKKLKANSEAWVDAVKTQGLPPEQAQLLTDIVKLSSDMGEFDPAKLYGSMMHHSRNALLGRKPGFIFPVGTETKRGKRQDVLEIYRTEEEALAAARNMGVDVEPEVFPSLDEALRGEAGIVNKDGDQIKLSEILEKTNAFDKGAPVYTLKVSLKNYMKFEGDGALMGGGMKTTFPSLLTVTNENFDEPFMQKIQEITGIDDVKAFKKYSMKLQGISNKVNGLGNTTFTKTGRIKTNNLKNLTIVTRAAVRDNSLDMTEAGKRLTKALETFQNRVKIAGLGDSEYIRAKEYVSRYLESYKLFGDINSENSKTKKTAQQYLAAQMLHAGGSDDDETLCDYRGLNTGEDYIFKQNDPLKDAWKSIMSGGKDPQGNNWQLKTDLQTGKYELVVAGNPKVKITFEPRIIPRKSGGQITGYATQFQTRLNKSALKYFNKLVRSKTEQSKVDEAFRHIMVALSLLQEKVSVTNI